LRRYYMIWVRSKVLPGCDLSELSDR
jgi:hypothetical protein